MLLCNLLVYLNQRLSVYEFNTHIVMKKASIVMKKSKHVLKEVNMAYEIEREIVSKNDI